MQEDYITKIRSAYNQFTKAEKKVADYILANPRQVLFMSISDLAEACDVGDTSVFRFCKTMNVKGYQEFKMMLSLSMRSNDSSLSVTEDKTITLEDHHILGFLFRPVILVKLLHQHPGLNDMT